MAVGLIDADVIAYTCAIKVQDDFGDELVADVRRAIVEAEKMIESWLKLAQCKIPLLCFSPKDGRPTFRYDLFPQYKAKRKGTEKPIVYHELVEYLERKYKVIRLPRLEADDILGIYATSDKLDNPVAISIDKDILTIPGRVCLVNKMTRPMKISKASADRAWMYQTLLGDSADGYKGAKGIGDVKANAILDQGSDLSSWWKLVSQTFRDKKQTNAIQQARLARILRREDWNPAKQEIRLWHPNKQEYLYVGT